MAETNIKVLKIELDTSNGELKVNGLKTSIEGLEKSVSGVTKESRKLNSALKDTSSAAGIAGATAQELGRFVSDLPYGINAVTNNLSQLGSLFGILVVKAGGFRAAISSLWKTMMGPVGVLFAFQAVIAAIEFFSKKTSEAEDAVNSQTKSLMAQSEVLKILNAELSKNNITQEKREQILSSLMKLDKELGEALEFYNGNLEQQNKLIEQRSDLIDAEIDFKNATASAEERLVIIQGELNQKRAFADKLSKSSNSSTRQYLALTTEIQDLEEEQLKIKNDLIKSGDKYNKTQKEYNERLKEISDEIKRINDLEKLLEKWRVKRLEAETESDLELLKLKESFAIKEAKALGATKKQLLDIERYYQIQRYRLEKEGLEKVEALKTKGIVDASKERKTELQIWAEEQLKSQVKNSSKELKALADALNKRKQIQENLDQNIEDARQEKLDKQIAIAQAVGAVVSGIADNIDAAYQKEIDLEQNKTTALNNELRQRLANEQLSANERKNIQDQIAKNDENLRKKQEKIEKKRFKANKAAAIAEATINTFLAATGVLKSTDGGSVARIAGMIAVIGSGLAQVAMIAKQQFVSSQSSIGAGVGAGSSGGNQVQAPDFNIVGQSGSNQLAAAVQGQLSQPIKAFVVSKDVSTAQEMDRNIIGSASLG